jgi:hypothetical protein
MNPLTRLLFGSGRLPDQLRAELTREGVLLLEEGLPGSITRRNWRAPGKYASWKKAPTSGAIAITRYRLVVWVARSKYINLPLTHRLRHALEVVAEHPDRVLFAWEASVFDKSKTRSGREEVRLRTAQADRVAALWNAGSPAG